MRSSRWRSRPRPKSRSCARSQVLIAFLQPLSDRPKPWSAWRSAAIIAFAMESIPRTTRAQSMDALSSQATVSGYKAVLMAAERLPKFFLMLTTAAGTIDAREGASSSAPVSQGSRRSQRRGGFGAVVFGFDVRPVVREQVCSPSARRS